MSNGTALHSVNNAETARQLVESVEVCKQKEFILSVDDNKCTPLHVAAHEGKTDVVEYLCSLSTTDNELILKQDVNGRIALHHAGNSKIAKLLVEAVLPGDRNSFILSVDDGQLTALHVAVMLEKTQVVEYLCSFSELYVPLMFGQDFFSNTAMHYATNKKIVSCMLSGLKSAQIDELLSVINNVGNTIILSLAEFGQHESLAELFQHIENKADLKLRTYLEQHNYTGQNIFHLAARSLFLDSCYAVLKDYVGCLKLENMMFPDMCGNTPIHYVAAKYDTRIFADFMLQLSLPTRQEIINSSNSKLIDCRMIIRQKKFSESFYIKKVLADDEHSSLATKFAFFGLIRKDGKQQLAHPENVYKYDESILKVLKYCLNEYSLLDSAYTTSHSLSLAAVCQQKSRQENTVS